MSEQMSDHPEGAVGAAVAGAVNPMYGSNTPMNAKEKIQSEFAHKTERERVFLPKDPSQSPNNIDNVAKDLTPLSKEKLAQFTKHSENIKENMSENGSNVMIKSDVSFVVGQYELPGESDYADSDNAPTGSTSNIISIPTPDLADTTDAGEYATPSQVTSEC